ncbi:MAG: CheR family methyltransferase [Polyangiaceae bacterium]
MTSAPSSADIERFRAVVAARLGIWFDDPKFEYLAGILDRRLAATADVPARYLNALETPNQVPGEVRELARELTVGETYFFRHTDQFRAFAEVALPERLAARAITKQLRLLSAGCSSGEEAYTLSILTREAVHDPSWEVRIDGVDLNPNAVARARAARYSPWALRETPARVEQQYFVSEGREHVLSTAIRDSVRFEEGNLVTDDSWAPESFDVIFCRNVLMYFTPENARRVVQRLSRALSPGGFLFLGHAENLRGLSHDFELSHTHATFYYRRRDGRGRSSAPLRLPELGPTPVQRSALALDWASTWLETVQRSSDRIRYLTDQSGVASPAAPSPALGPPAARLDLSVALELLSHERFAEALEVLTKMPSNCTQDADAVLLRAALLTHCGQLEAAELACTELLLLDSLNCGAHYLRALCRERQADTRAAIEHAQIASYLDPSFAMPHLHLGLMARRMGDRETAQRELTLAALLLEREEPSRLLLFGGGFSREGLAALCHSELTRLGATP